MKRCHYCLEELPFLGVSYFRTIAKDAPGPYFVTETYSECAACHDAREEKRERREAAEEDRRGE